MRAEPKRVQYVSVCQEMWHINLRADNACSDELWRRRRDKFVAFIVLVLRFSRDHGQEKEGGKDHKVDDTLKHRRPPSA